MKILIAEDEVIPANYLKKLLELEGYDVLETVESGAKAIQVAKQESPDVVLMDVMLEDSISGCDAAVEITHNNHQIRIIFLTAYSDKEMIDFAIESNAFGYLLKPYRDKEILATLALLKAKLTKEESTEDISTKSGIVDLVGGYSYNSDTQTLLYQSQEKALGPQAIKLIDLLCKHKNVTLHTDTIIELLWGTEKSTQALRSLVYRIREATIQGLIKNSSKTGYQIGLGI